MWRLTRAWYGDRLAPDYAAKSVDHLQRLLSRSGLTAAFWQLG